MLIFLLRRLSCEKRLFLNWREHSNAWNIEIKMFSERKKSRELRYEELVESSRSSSHLHNRVILATHRTLITTINDSPLSFLAWLFAPPRGTKSLLSLCPVSSRRISKFYQVQNHVLRTTNRPSSKLMILW